MKQENEQSLYKKISTFYILFWSYTYTASVLLTSTTVRTANIHTYTTGSSLTARSPNIQVTASRGKKITVALSNDLYNDTLSG